MMGYPIWKLLLAAFGAFFVLLAFLYAPYALAQDKHDHTLMGDVGKFYSQWKIPNGGKTRVSSCCNFKDCHETQVRIDKGKWSYLSVETGNWTPLPEGIIEHNQPDPEISPNSKPHVCEPHGLPVCAVIPGGQI